MIGQVETWMQQSLGINRLGPVWTFFRFVWTIRNVVSIVLLLCTVLYLLFSETLTQRRLMLEQFGQAQSELAKKETAFASAGAAVFAGPSQDGRSVTPEQAEALAVAGRALRAELMSSYAPNQRIEQAKYAYARAVADVLGKLNLFVPGGDGTVSVLTALNELEGPAASYHSAAKSYQSSVWVSFIAAF